MSELKDRDGFPLRVGDRVTAAASGPGVPLWLAGPLSEGTVVKLGRTRAQVTFTSEEGGKPRSVACHLLRRKAPPPPEIQDEGCVVSSLEWRHGSPTIYTQKKGKLYLRAQAEIWIDTPDGRRFSAITEVHLEEEEG